MKNLAILPLLIALSGSPVLAQVSNITEAQAIGGVPSLSLKLNQGVNITLPTGTKVYKGWLDDQEFAEVDGDRPFEQGASRLYLVPRKTGSTHLRLITQNQEGGEALYVFKLVSGTETQSNPIVSITASSQPIPSSSSVQSQKAVYAKAEDDAVSIFNRGIEAALAQGLLAPNSELHQALSKFVRKVGSGLSVYDAAAQNGLQPATVEQLFELGRQAPIPSILVKQESPMQVAVSTEPMPKPMPKAVEKTPTSIEQATASTEKSSPSLEKSVPAEEYSALLNRVEKLEKRVGTLDTKLARLDSQQTEFVAKLNSLDRQQNIFQAKLENGLSSPKQRPITLAIALEEADREPETERDIQTAIAKGGPTIEEEENTALLLAVPSVPKSYTSRELATSLRRGLTVAHHEGQIRHGSSMYYQMNNVIRMVNFDGTALPKAAQMQGIPEKTITQVLKWGEVNPSDVGF